ncbi:hypothetical protein SFC65_19330 [Priestia filamentosa]|uniref:hypothetical protein n=1 Tax=Priestia filamentosa TaxID=1402861 RepID=UPI003982391D
MQKAAAAITLVTLIGLIVFSGRTVDKEEKTATVKSYGENTLSETVDPPPVRTDAMKTYKGPAQTDLDIDLDERIVKKRVDFLKGKPTFAIEEDGQFNVLGVKLGDSYNNVIHKFDRADASSHTETYRKYDYYVPGEELQGNVLMYHMVVQTTNNKEPVVQQILLDAYEEDGKIIGINLPENAFNHFIGTVYLNSPTSIPINNIGAEYSLLFEHKAENFQNLIYTREDNTVRVKLNTSPDSYANDKKKGDKTSSYQPIGMMEVQQVLNKK